MPRWFSRPPGLSLIELIIALAILSVLAAAVLPLAEVTVKRSREIELRQALRSIRTAIDHYKADYDEAVRQKKITVSINETGYPKELEDLVDGSDWGGLYPFKRKYLRRIPRDPFATDASVEPAETWEKRSYADDPESTVWGGEDVFDVYSQSEETAIDGTQYNNW